MKNLFLAFALMFVATLSFATGNDAEETTTDEFCDYYVDPCGNTWEFCAEEIEDKEIEEVWFWGGGCN